jgi:hypothetical protein
VSRPTHVKSYTGESQQAAWTAFQGDAADAARHGWVPVSHRWAPGFLEVTYQPLQPPPTGRTGPDWRLPPDAGSGRRAGSVGRAIVLAAVIGAVGGFACLLLWTRVDPDWHLVSGLNDFLAAAMWASFACSVIGVVAGIRWQHLDGCGAWLTVGLVGWYLAVMLEFTMGVTLLSLLPS